MHHTWLHRYAILLAVSTLFLVVAGASVTSNEAGLAVPDWPLSYGQLMPEMTGGIFYEHGHRMIATTVGCMTIIMAIWLARLEDRRWMRRLGWAALGAVCLQGLLGGMTVIFMLPKPVSISHACLAQLFFSTTVALALFTSEQWRRGPHLVTDNGRMRSLALAVPVAILAQLALGAAHRHKALGLVPHVVGAAIVTAIVVWAVYQVLTDFQRHDALRRAALQLAAATLAQVFLGIAAYMSRVVTADAPQPLPLMVSFTVVHVAVGALTMAAGIIFSIQVFRNVTSPAGVRLASVPSAS